MTILKTQLLIAILNSVLGLLILYMDAHFVREPHGLMYLSLLVNLRVPVPPPFLSITSVHVTPSSFKLGLVHVSSVCKFLGFAVQW